MTEKTNTKTQWQTRVAALAGVGITIGFSIATTDPKGPIFFGAGLLLYEGANAIAGAFGN